MIGRAQRAAGYADLLHRSGDGGDGGPRRRPDRAVVNLTPLDRHRDWFQAVRARVATGAGGDHGIDHNQN
jgi:hypothetical protein